MCDFKLVSTLQDAPGNVQNTEHVWLLKEPTTVFPMLQRVNLIRIGHLLDRRVDLGHIRLVTKHSIHFSSCIEKTLRPLSGPSLYYELTSLCYLLTYRDRVQPPSYRWLLTLAALSNLKYHHEYILTLITVTVISLKWGPYSQYQQLLKTTVGKSVWGSKSRARKQHNRYRACRYMWF